MPAIKSRMPSPIRVPVAPQSKKDVGDGGSGCGSCGSAGCKPGLSCVCVGFAAWFGCRLWGCAAAGVLFCCAAPPDDAGEFVELLAELAASLFEGAPALTDEPPALEVLAAICGIDGTNPESTNKIPMTAASVPTRLSILRPVLVRPRARCRELCVDRNMCMFGSFCTSGLTGATCEMPAGSTKERGNVGGGSARNRSTVCLRSASSC